jgi:hypothetical protein
MFRGGLGGALDVSVSLYDRVGYNGCFWVDDVTKMFLRRNGKRLRIARLEDACLFISRLETKTVEQVQDWIEDGESERSQRRVT